MVKVRYKRLLVVLGLLLLATIIALWSLTRMAPDWYQPPRATDLAVVELADRVEFRLLEEFQKIRSEPEPWKLRIRQQHINAWLATKLPDWIAHHESLSWPRELGQPQVRLDPEGISLAISIEAVGPEKVIVVRIQPRIENGELIAEVNRISLGQLNLPGEPVERIVNLIHEYVTNVEIDDPSIQLIFRMLRGEERIDPVLNLADSRRVRLTDITLEPGAIVLTAQTLPGEAKDD